jgi:serine protease Do
MTPMRQLLCRAALAALVVVLGGVGAVDRAEASHESRKNWVVRAVEKTRDSIVAVKVEKAGEWGSKEVIGTGVIIDESGYVVTNHHVVSSAERITVRLADQTALRGTVLSDDAAHDLAIVRLAGGRKLKALRFAPAGDLMVGEDVIAIGHPFGYNYTVSTGIVSALGREIEMPSGYTLTNLIQTNASINPGNSGGPLLNHDGELIGINVALREGAQGIAFALNADSVQSVLSKQLSARKVAGVRLGIVCREVLRGDDEDRQRVVVDEVTERSPAARAGLKQGDVIVRVGDRSVGNRFDLERSLFGHRAGDQVQAAIVRQGKTTLISLTLGGVDEGERVSSLARARGE